MARKKIEFSWLRRRRQELGLTMEQCASLVGVSRQAWDRWEYSDYFPRPRQVAAMAALLKVEPKQVAKEMARARHAKSLERYWPTVEHAEEILREAVE